MRCRLAMCDGVSRVVTTERCEGVVVRYRQCVKCGFRWKTIEKGVNNVSDKVGGSDSGGVGRLDA